jgi:hypothetical protein
MPEIIAETSSGISISEHQKIRIPDYHSERDRLYLTFYI